MKINLKWVLIIAAIIVGLAAVGYFLLPGDQTSRDGAADLVQQKLAKGETITACLITNKVEQEVMILENALSIPRQVINFKRVDGPYRFCAVIDIWPDEPMPFRIFVPEELQINKLFIYERSSEVKNGRFCMLHPTVIKLQNGEFRFRVIRENPGEMLIPIK